MDLDTLSQEDLKLLRKQISSKINKVPKHPKMTIDMLLKKLGGKQPELKATLRKICRPGGSGKQMGRLDSDGRPVNVRYTLLSLLEFFQKQRFRKYSKTITSRDEYTSTFLQVIYTSQTDSSYDRSYVALLSNAQVVYGPACHNIQTPGEWVLWPEPETIFPPESYPKDPIGYVPPAQLFTNRYDAALQVFSDGFITALKELPVKPTQRVLTAMMRRQQDGSDNPQHALNKTIIESSERVFKDMGDAASRAILKGTDPPAYPSLGEWIDVCIELSAYHRNNDDYTSPYSNHRRRRTTNGISIEYASFPLLTRLLSTTNLIAADFGTGAPYEGIFSIDIGDIVRKGVVEQHTINARAAVLEKAVAMKLGFIDTSVGWLKVSPAMYAKQATQATDVENRKIVGDPLSRTSGFDTVDKYYREELDNASFEKVWRLLKFWSPCVMVTHESSCLVNGSYRCVVDATSDPLPKGDQTARRMLMFASTYRDAIYTLANDKKMLEDLFADVPYETIRECREIVIRETGGPKAAPLDPIQLN